MLSALRRDHCFRGATAPLFAVALVVLAAACGGDDKPGPTGPGPSASADLAVMVTGPATATAGSQVTFQLSVINDGPDASAGVALSATLPAGVTATTISDGGTQAGSTVTWTMGTLTDGQSIDRSVTLRPMQPGEVRVTGHASATTEDPVATNNDGSAATSTAVTSVVTGADVVVRLFKDHENAVSTGEAVAWSLEVSNVGTAAATGVATRLVLSPRPSGLIITDGGTVAGDTITWPAIGTLAAGGTVLYAISGVAPLIGPVGARASSTSLSLDVDGANNDGSSSAAQNTTSITFEVVGDLDGESIGDEFGRRMAVVGDLNADGASEIVVGAPSSDAGGTDAGRVYVYSVVSRVLMGTATGAPGDRLGFSVAGAGDVNDDGIPDAVVGGPGGVSGRVIVLSGADGSVLHDLTGDAPGDSFGHSVGGLGDVNADGYAEFVVSAPGNDAAGAETGRVYVVDGQTGAYLASFSPGIAGAFFGSAVSGIGDVSGDGLPDFAVGAADASGSGRIYVLNGVTAAAVYAPIAPAASGGNLGLYWLDGVSDVNGDLVPDIYAGDINDSGTATDAGRAYIFSGADGSTLQSFGGESAGDQLGIGHALPDVNGDGFGDVIVATWRSDEGATDGGKVYIYSGADGRLLRNFVATIPDEMFAVEAIGIGDLTGDGIVDFLVTGGNPADDAGHVHLIEGLRLN
jgi:uncharacterized repeat protein (TIGR01451 family)